MDRWNDLIFYVQYVMFAHWAITSERLWLCIKTSLSSKNECVYGSFCGLHLGLAQHLRLPVFLWKTTCFSEQILQFADNLIGKVRLSLCVFELASVPNQIQWEKCQLQLEEGNANLPSGLLAICLIPLCKIICCKRSRSARMKPHWLLLELYWHKDAETG